MKPYSIGRDRQKKCSICGRLLPITEFHRRQHHVRCGFRAACKECTREAERGRDRKVKTDLDILKRRVRQRTKRALARGHLEALPCRVCNDPQAEVHHPRYDTPDAHLQVVWLCRYHHALLHGIRPWTRQRDLFESVAPSDVTETHQEEASNPGDSSDESIP